MPTIKDLNSRIPDGIHAECQTLRHYCYWLRELCHGAPEYLNIESVATNILTAQIFPSEEERLRNAELRFELLRFIAQAMHRTVPLSSAASQMLSAFLNAIANDKENEGRKNLILSFNYDTLIEDQIRQDPNLFSTIAVDYGVNIEPADRSACHGNRPKSIDLLKLHGSLNWYSIKGSGGELDLKNVCRIEADGPQLSALPKGQSDFHSHGARQRFLFAGKPVQCTLGKSGLLPSNADEIYVIGYGFPQTDWNSFPFLLKHRDRIRQVVVFESAGDASIARLERLFDKGIVVCEDAKQFLSRLFPQSFH